MPNGSAAEPTGLAGRAFLPLDEEVRAAVEAGAGVAALSGFVVGAAQKSGRLVALPFPLLTCGFHPLLHQRRNRSCAAAAFLAVAVSSP